MVHQGKNSIEKRVTNPKRTSNVLTREHSPWGKYHNTADLLFGFDQTSKYVVHST